MTSVGSIWSSEASTSERRSSITFIGLVLGTAAALVSVSWPGQLGFLPSPSTMLTLLAVVVAVSQSGQSVLSFRFNGFDGAVLLLLIARLTSEFINAAELGHAAHSGVFTTLLFLWLATIPPRLLIGSTGELRTFLFWLTAPAVGVAVLALLQMVRFPGVMDWILANVSVGGLEARIEAGRTDLRSTSTIGHWTSLGGYLAVAIAVYCAELLLARTPQARRRRPFVLLAILVMFLGELTTLTFSTVGIAAAVILITFLRLRGNPLLVGLAAVVAVIGWQVFGSEIEGRLDQQSTVSRYTDESLRWLPSTVAYRVRIWQGETIPTWLERPITGWGQQTYDFPPSWTIFPRLLAWPSPESQWLNVLVRGGLLELAAFVVFLVVAFRIMRRSRSLLGAAVSPLTVLFVGLLITFLINSPLSTNGVPQILWPLLGALLAVPRISSNVAIESARPA